MLKNCASAKRRSSERNAETLVLTGAGGFIAASLIRKISFSGRRVVLLGRKPDPGFPLGSNMDYISCDITRRDSLKKLKKIKGKVVLLHLAAFVPRRPSEEDKFTRRLFDTNIGGTVALLEALEGKLSRVCYASTLEVYGIPKSLPIREDSAADPVSIYGASKLAAERCVRIFCEERRIPFLILRLSSIYGPGEDFDRALPNFIRSARSGKPVKIYGDGCDKRDYLYIDDAADALLLAAASKASGKVINIASGESVSIKELAQRVISLCGSRSKIDLSPRNKPRYDIVFSTYRSRKLLGFCPRISLEEGLFKEINSAVF